MPDQVGPGSEREPSLGGPTGRGGARGVRVQAAEAVGAPALVRLAASILAGAGIWLTWVLYSRVKLSGCCVQWERLRGQGPSAHCCRRVRRSGARRWYRSWPGPEWTWIGGPGCRRPTGGLWIGVALVPRSMASRTRTPSRTTTASSVWACASAPGQSGAGCGRRPSARTEVGQGARHQAGTAAVIGFSPDRHGLRRPSI